MEVLPVSHDCYSGFFTDFSFSNEVLQPRLALNSLYSSASSIPHVTLCPVTIQAFVTNLRLICFKQLKCPQAFYFIGRLHYHFNFGDNIFILSVKGGTKRPIIKKYINSQFWNKVPHTGYFEINKYKGKVKPSLWLWLGFIAKVLGLTTNTQNPKLLEINAHLILLNFLPQSLTHPLLGIMPLQCFTHKTYGWTLCQLFYYLGDGDNRIRVKTKLEMVV